MQRLLDESNMCYDKKLLDSLKESDNYIVIMLDNEHLVSFVTRDIMVDSNLLEYFIDFRDHRGINGEEFVIFIGHRHDKIIGLIILDVEKTIESEIDDHLQLFYKLVGFQFFKISRYRFSVTDSTLQSVTANGRGCCLINQSKSFVSFYTDAAEVGSQTVAATTN